MVVPRRAMSTTPAGSIFIELLTERARQVSLNRGRVGDDDADRLLG